MSDLPIEPDKKEAPTVLETEFQNLKADFTSALTMMQNLSKSLNEQKEEIRHLKRENNEFKEDIRLLKAERVTVAELPDDDTVSTSNRSNVSFYKKRGEKLFNLHSRVAETAEKTEKAAESTPEPKKHRSKSAEKRNVTIKEPEKEVTDDQTQNSNNKRRIVASHYSTSRKIIHRQF